MVSQAITKLDNAKEADERGQVKLQRYKKLKIGYRYNDLIENLTTALDKSEELVGLERKLREEMKDLGFEIGDFKHHFLPQPSTSHTPEKSKKKKKKKKKSKDSSSSSDSEDSEVTPSKSKSKRKRSMSSSDSEDSEDELSSYIPVKKTVVTNGTSVTLFYCPNHPDVSYKRRYSAKLHMKTACKGMKPFKCVMLNKDGKTCNKEFARKQNLLEHQCSHTGKDIYTCKWKKCAKTFTHSRDKSDHEKVCQHKKEGLKPKK